MANRELKDRGSRKHVLDFIESVDFHQQMNRILLRSGFRLAGQPRLQPHGRQDADAWSEFEIDEYFADGTRQLAGLAPVKPDWWIKHKNWQNRCPTWDLIARLQSLVDGTTAGVLLVEAKANGRELKIRDAKSEPTSSKKSQENHAQINACIRQANKRLSRLGCGPFHMSEADHYQLANRLACSVHPADQGYRTVLLYLGFTGDTYFHDPITGEHHWQRMIGGYFQGVVPQTFPEHECPMGNGGSLRLLVQSQPAIEISR